MTLPASFATTGSEVLAIGNRRRTLYSVVLPVDCRRTDLEQYVGQTIQLSGVPHEVVGILSAEFEYPDNTQIWLPLAMSGDLGFGTASEW